MDPIQGLDFGTFYWFRHQRQSGSFDLSPVIQLGDSLGSYIVLVAIAVAGFILLMIRRRHRAALAWIISMAVGLVLGEFLRRLVNRPRPPDADIWLGTSRATASFPCMPALLSSLVFLLLAITLQTIIARRGFRLAAYAFCLILVLWIGTSQLYLGLSFLTDLLAGWTGGVLLGMLADMAGSISRVQVTKPPR